MSLDSDELNVKFLKCKKGKFVWPEKDGQCGQAEGILSESFVT